MTMKYRYVGAHVDNLDDGTVIAPLQEVTLSADAEKGKHASRLLDQGLLLEIKPKAASAAKEGGDK
jgi:hypothetical protein